MSHCLGRDDGCDLSGQDRLAMYPWLTLDLGFFLPQLWIFGKEASATMPSFCVSWCDTYPSVLWYSCSKCLTWIIMGKLEKIPWSSQPVFFKKKSKESGWWDGLEVKTSVAKPDDVNMIPKTHLVEGENRLSKVVLWSHAWWYTQINKMEKEKVWRTVVTENTKETY